MVGRKKELSFLNEQYNAGANSLVILYGRQGTGKTTLINEFLKDKSHIYYLAKECQTTEQQFLMKEELEKSTGAEINGVEFADIIKDSLNSFSGADKVVVVIDEIYNELKQGPALRDAIADVLENYEDKSVMFILTSSSVWWVENHMVKDLGKLAMSITAFNKLSGLDFVDIVNRFESLSSRQCVYIYGILGGVPGYVDMWKDKSSVKSNIINLFLDKNGLFYREPERFLKSELRELSFYNTILANLAAGRVKLNELHARTGFSRAKISVYIKNLIQLDIVEKRFSSDEGDYSRTQKGVYCIKDPFMHFWYKFVFPNTGLLEMGHTEYVYDNIIEPQLSDYMHPYFVKVCKEYLNLMNQYKRLPVNYEICESWNGKEHNIDIIAKDIETGELIAGMCKWSDEPYSDDDFAAMIEKLEYAKIDCEYYYLFSKSGFREDFEISCKQINNVILIDLNSL